MAFGAEVAELIVALRLDDKGFRGKLNNASRSLGGIQRGLGQMGRGAGQVGTGIDKIATRVAVAGAGLATFAVTTAASFEQAEAGIRKTVDDGINVSVDDLIDNVREMARTMPVSFEELAAITAEGGALGVATDNLDEFTEIVARLGVSTDLTTEAASSALGQLSNVLGLSDEDLRDFADSLVALGNDGASTESQILDMTTRFGAAGKQAGLSNEAILALASTTASMGIEAEAGGGALSRVFNGITGDIANASEESEALAGAMGMSLDELRTAWDRDAGAVFGDLLGYINELDQFEANKFLGDLGITNQRDINAIMLLAEGVDEYQRQLGVAEGQTDELNRESDVFFNTTEGRWKRLQNNISDAAAIIGTEMLPVVNELADDFMGWLNQPDTQRGIREFAESLSSGIRDFVDEVKNADFGPLLDTLKGAAAIAKTAFDAFNALPSGLKSLIIGGIAINKVTGGALGDLAKGLGNLAGGGIKLLFDRGSPANPMWVKSVDGILGGPTGGAPAAGGRAGGGRLGGALAFLGPLFVAGVADALEEPSEALAQEIHNGTFLKDNPLAGIGPQDLSWPFGPKNTPTILPELFGGNGILGGTNKDPASLEKTTRFSEMTAANTRDAIPWLQRNRTEIMNLNANEGRRFAHLGSLSIAEKDAIHALNASEGQRAATLQTRVSEAKAAVHTMNASEGTRAANIMAIQRTANSYQSRTASATERVAGKNFSPTIKLDNHITIPVNVSSTIIEQRISQQYIARYQTPTSPTAIY